MTTGVPHQGQRSTLKLLGYEIDRVALEKDLQPFLPDRLIHDPAREFRERTKRAQCRAIAGFVVSATHRIDDP